MSTDEQLDTDNKMTPRISSVSVKKVLGEFDHEFEFASQGTFAIIYGPNGVGKTRVLEIVNALCNLNSNRLDRLPFESAKISFTDKTWLSVERVRGKAKDSEEPELEPNKHEAGMRFELQRPGSEIVSSLVSGLSAFHEYLLDNTPYEPTDNDDVWIDPNDGEIVRFNILRRRYLAQFRNISASAAEDPSKPKLIDQQIREFAEQIEVRFIETQRLIVREVDEDLRTGFREPSAQQIPTIKQYSEQVKRTLNGNLSANSRLTQSLDSTFPRRMLERGDQSILSEAELRAKWAEQTTRRARLTKIADLKIDAELSLPEESLNLWQLGMLELYLEDADKKLDSFSDVLSRIDLLENIVNERLLRKNLRIDANDGIVVVRHLDGSQVPLTSLSSGEQHEIIMMFDLLFNVEPGAIVMIDEPEISLHIGWQKKFITDVMRVSSLVGFQFLVATHSPQIIDRWWSYASQLGPTSDEEFIGLEGVAEVAG